MCARPVIGIPADRRVLEPHPFHMVGEKYIDAVRSGAEALPVLIPASGDDTAFDDWLHAIDGLFLTGSPSNVEPHRYNGTPSRPGTWHDAARDATTLPLIDKVLEAGVPLLAVCRGFQEINVALGGSLHQYVHEVPGYRNHRENPDDPLAVQYGPSHRVTLVEGGLLAGFAGRSSVEVNSLHSQGIARLADGVTVEAIADDGLVEGFRIDGADTFALAVQWHPEWQVMDDPLSLAIFQAFAAAARARAERRG